MKTSGHHLRRKKRPIDPMGGLGLLNRHSRESLEQDQLRDLGLAYLGALRGMTTGHGNEQQWSTLACSINVAMVLAELGVMPQGLQIIQNAQDALIRVRAHAQISGEWQLGIHAFPLECALKLHNQQIKEAGRNQVITAINEVYRRVQEGHHK